MVSCPRSVVDVRRLFDGMSPNKKGKKAPMAAAADHIGVLPDEILHHLLSFLPAQEAVRTCVLARRWRHLWKFTTGLRIVEFEDARSVKDVRKFVDHLLILRGHTGLNTFVVELSEFFEDDDVPAYVNLWIRFAVMCKVRVLNVVVCDDYSYLDDLPLVSRQLRTLDLRRLELQGTFLDFASCPALEDLQITDCGIHAGRPCNISFAEAFEHHRLPVDLGLPPAPCLHSGPCLSESSSVSG